MKPIDLTKFQKTITKSLDTISVGFTNQKFGFILVITL